MDKKESIARQTQPLTSLRERLTRYMEEKALRKTPERYEILRVAGLANGIFNIDELMELMQKHAKFQVSRATLFNTMELFLDAGLVIKHPLATAAHYELRTDIAPKAYVICRQCNTITKVSTSTASMALVNLRKASIHEWPLSQVSSKESTRGKNLKETENNQTGQK